MPPQSRAAGRGLQRLYIAGIIALLILPLLLSAFIAYRGARDAEQRVKDDRLALAQATALTASAFIDAHVAGVRTLARSPDVRDVFSRPDIWGVLAQALLDTPEWERIEVFDSDGWTLVGSGQDVQIRNVADQPHFRQALTTGRPVVGPSDAGQNGLAVPVAVPVQFVNETAGVLVVSLSAARLNSIMEAAWSEEQLDLVLLDGTGRIVARSGPGNMADGLLSQGLGNPAELARLQFGVHMRAGADGAEFLVAAAPVAQAGWTALALQPAATAFGPVRDQLRTQLVLLATTAAVIGVIAFFLSRRLALSYERELGALRRVDQFITSASHDLKTPLTAVKTLAQLMQRRVARTELKDAGWFEESLAGIDTAVTKMTAQIDELLDVSRLEQRRSIDIAPRQADLVALVQRAVKDQQQTTTRHQIRVESAAPKLVGRFDPERIERVLANLIGNAIKYSPNGGDVLVSVQRERGPAGATGTEGAEPADWAVIRVQDQGLGIPATDLPYVFERFHRAGNVTGRVSGSGIGLAGARQIVEQHGGAISVESVEGQGSTFIVRLPLQQRRAVKQTSAA